ncbi:alpha-mannosidase [Streptomyces sp. NRRL S-146]|uniref:alpha-mannosidase n=1 Tax=Streptomyces sp. NRRL S-146 TaxID=1463884 RepID=UPI000B02F1EE|nr:alpha-mannosidase [Streptomyces sp. NRRL S-146]
MHDESRRIEERVQRLHDQRIKTAVYAATVPFEVEAWQAPGEPVPFEEAAAASYEPFSMGTPWGPPWGTTWFRMRGQVPAEWAGRRVEAVIDLGFTGDWPGNQAEALVHLTDGTPLKAVNPLNQYVAIANPAQGGESVDYLVEAASNPDILADNFSKTTPLGDKLTAGDKPLYTFRAADIAILDEEVWHLDLDVQVLRELMLELGEHDPRRHEIAHALDRAMDLLDLDDVSGSAAAVREALKPVLSRPAHASAHTISGVGHAHIDSAWLWPIRETKRKTSRTFSNVTSLADEYDDFIFACSQAQQYEWVRDNYPKVWARIQESVKNGQWAPVGGMWVESDGNLPGGEAVARQFVHGKRFFMDHFGIETKGVWLPDSFGYNAAYPQIAKLAGNEWFLTQKISWNQTNRFPHHTFWWEGIDGTRIFTHFPPVDTYNARFSGEEMSRAVRNYSEKGGASRSLAPFGWGDGGGGPTREIMERARRLADLEGSAKVVVEHPDEFFAKAREEYPDAPVWVGELYLELHRATYTSQARTKQGNRRSEHLLREAELWATTAALHAPDYSYPYEKLDRLWKTVLLHQFHDILPGSSIAWVHREAEAEYARVARELHALTAEAVAALGTGEPRAFNTSPYDRAEVVRTGDGTPVFVEVPASGSAPLAAPVLSGSCDSAATLPGPDRQRTVFASVVRDSEPRGHPASRHARTVTPRLHTADGLRHQLDVRMLGVRRAEEQMLPVAAAYLDPGRVVAAVAGVRSGTWVGVRRPAVPGVVPFLERGDGHQDLHAGAALGAGLRAGVGGVPSGPAADLPAGCVGQHTVVVRVRVHVFLCCLRHTPLLELLLQFFAQLQMVGVLGDLLRFEHARFR